MGLTGASFRKVFSTSSYGYLNLNSSLPYPEAVRPVPLIANVTFAEGPAFDSNGILYFVNYHVEGSIGRYRPDGTGEVWAQSGGVPNGIRFDGDGHIVVADKGVPRILRFDVQSRAMEVLTSAFEGNRYNGPNDVCLDHNGNIFFTDPNRQPGQSGSVYRIEMSSTNRSVGIRQLDQDLPYPNGLAVHPDQQQLFVAMTHINSIVSYDLDADGLVSNRQLVHEFDSPSGDGIQFDADGRLWGARWLEGTIDVIAPESGSFLRSYPMSSDQVTDLAFWDGSVYVSVAGRNGIERLDVGVVGADIVPNWSRRQSIEAHT